MPDRSPDLGVDGAFSHAGELLIILEVGDMALFAAAFSKVTELKAQLTHELLFGARPEGLAVACRAVGLDRGSFLRMLQVLEQNRAGDAVPDPASRENARSLFDSSDRDSARRVLELWQSGAGYLEALSSLKFES